MRTPVVHRTNGSKAFLPCGIPKLKFYCFVVNLDRLNFLRGGPYKVKSLGLSKYSKKSNWEAQQRCKTYEIDAYGRHLRTIKLVVRKLLQQTCFPSGSIPNNDNFEEIIATNVQKQSDVSPFKLLYHSNTCRMAWPKTSDLLLISILCRVRRCHGSCCCFCCSFFFVTMIRMNGRRLLLVNHDMKSCGGIMQADRNWRVSWA